MNANNSTIETSENIDTIKSELHALYEQRQKVLQLVMTMEANRAPASDRVAILESPEMKALEQRIGEVNRRYEALKTAAEQQRLQAAREANAEKLNDPARTLKGMEKAVNAARKALEETGQAIRRIDAHTGSLQKEKAAIEATIQKMADDEVQALLSGKPFEPDESAWYDLQAVEQRLKTAATALQAAQSQQVKAREEVREQERTRDEFARLVDRIKARETVEQMIAHWQTLGGRDGKHLARQLAEFGHTAN